MFYRIISLLNRITFALNRIICFPYKMRFESVSDSTFNKSVMSKYALLTYGNMPV